MMRHVTLMLGCCVATLLGTRAAGQTAPPQLPATYVTIDPGSFWHTDVVDPDYYRIVMIVHSRSSHPTATLSAQVWDDFDKVARPMRRPWHVAQHAEVRYPWVDGGLDVNLYTSWEFYVSKDSPWGAMMSQPGYEGVQVLAVHDNAAAFGTYAADLRVLQYLQ